MTASKHKRQIIVLYVSTLLGVLLGVLSSIVNTKALDPIDYGDVRYVQNIINFIATFLLLGYFVSGISEHSYKRKRIFPVWRT